MNRVVPLLVLAVLSSCMASEPTPFPKPAEEIVLWPSGAPGEAGDVGPEDWSYTTDSWHVTNVTAPSLLLYPPPPGVAVLRGVFVVVAPGGAYNLLSADKEGTEICAWLGSLGVSAGVLKYRVPRRPARGAMWTAPLEDAQRAVGIVRSRLASWGLSERALVGQIGFSAGGHLTATLAAHMEARTYARVDAADDLSCALDFTMLAYPAYIAPDGDAYALDKEAVCPAGSTMPPPAWTMQAMDDGYHAECAIGYALMLKRLGVKASTFIGPDGGHGYGLRPSSHMVSAWPSVAEQWLRSSGFLAK
eukprot:m51a1_g107 putative xylanase (304) ;mRNA; r:326715-327626